MAKEDKIHNYTFVFGKKYQNEYDRIFGKKKAKKKKSVLSKSEKKILDKAIGFLNDREIVVAKQALERMIDLLERE